MYGKIFASMYDGTLRTKWQALVTFQQLIVLSDSEGIVDMTAEALSARTGIPLGVISEGLEFLEQPDKYSRSPEAGGKRIERLNEHRPWGWRIVNYLKYREIRDAQQRREYMRLYMRDRRKHVVKDVNSGKQQLAHAEAEAEAEASGVSEDRNSRPRARTTDAFHQDVIDAYHEILPGLPQVKVWTPRRARAIAARIRERCRDGKPADTIGYWRSLFEQVAASPFLCGCSTDFRADLEWLLRPENFAKVIEGRYNSASGRVNGVAHAAR